MACLTRCWFGVLTWPWNSTCACLSQVTLAITICTMALSPLPPRVAARAVSTPQIVYARGSAIYELAPLRVRSLFGGPSSALPWAPTSVFGPWQFGVAYWSPDGRWISRSPARRRRFVPATRRVPRWGNGATHHFRTLNRKHGLLFGPSWATNGDLMVFEGYRVARLGGQILPVMYGINPHGKERDGSGRRGKPGQTEFRRRIIGTPATGAEPMIPTRPCYQQRSGTAVKRSSSPQAYTS